MLLYFEMLFVMAQLSFQKQIILQKSFRNMLISCSGNISYQYFRIL